MEEGLDKKIMFAHVNDDAFVVLSSVHTPEDVIKRIANIGYPFKGQHGTRYVFGVPNDKHVVRRNFVYIQRITFEKDFQVYVSRGRCFCSEYHWDEYRGGGWSRVIFPEDDAWDTIPNPPALKPKTPEMLNQERIMLERAEQERIDRKRRIAARRDQRVSDNVGHTFSRVEEGRQAFMDDLAEIRDNLMETSNRAAIQELLHTESKTTPENK